MRKYIFASLIETVIKRKYIFISLIGVAAGILYGVYYDYYVKDPFTNRTDAVFSPHGSVPTGMAIYSPDGNYYCKEVEPYNNGHFCLFNNSTDKMIRQINLPTTPANDVKGIAFASNSRWLAVMYHELIISEIYIVDVKTGKLLTTETLFDWYHFMAFAKNSNTTLVLRATPHGEKIWLSINALNEWQNGVL